MCTNDPVTTLQTVLDDKEIIVTLETFHSQEKSILKVVSEDAINKSRQIYHCGRYDDKSILYVKQILTNLQKVGTYSQQFEAELLWPGSRNPLIGIILEKYYCQI